jgi:hypothetical protein
MTLVEFQQALCDLTASPARCAEARDSPELLRHWYRLTDREADRLTGIIRHDGMASACMVYRANRLAPLAMNLPDTCRALGPRLRSLAERYWQLHPETDVHFYIEANRFCGFLRDQAASGIELPVTVLTALDREARQITALLAESLTEYQD